MSRFTDSEVEIAQRNMRAIKQAVEKGLSNNDDRMTDIKALQQSLAMANQEIATLKQRLNVLQYGQVQGSTAR